MKQHDTIIDNLFYESLHEDIDATVSIVEPKSINSFPV